MTLERRLPAFYAAFFYAFPAAIAWVWLNGVNEGRSAELWRPEALGSGAAVGLGTGLAITGATILCSRLFAWARRLESEFGWILGAQRPWEIAWVALLSGMSEEYLFRGALQEKFGLWVAAAVFAVIHWPLNRNCIAWPFVAGTVGLALGGLRIWTGALWAPAIAHVVVNAVNLARITRRFRAWDETRVDDYIGGRRP